jgi:hypothetical protein
MFAGLPGIGVGTLFYVLTALWMPVCEFRRVLVGRSSLRRWRLIVVQFCFAVGIVASVALADRMMLWLLAGGAPGSVGPARFLNDRLATHAAQSILAAPIAASLLLLGGVLLVVEVMRVVRAFNDRRDVTSVTIVPPYRREILDSSKAEA